MNKEQYCTSCGFVGKGKYRGSLLTTLFLLLFFLVPGLVYEWWRTRKGPCVCPSCKAETLIPANSPNAKKLMAQ